MAVGFQATGIVEVFVDGLSVVTGTATGFAAGRVGLYSRKTKAIFDNFTVSRSIP